MKKYILNTLLIVISILFTYAAMEVLVRFTIPYLPRALFNNECRELRTIGQTSKKGSAPNSPYIAIIGDSYGAGQGDWFIEERYNPNSRYQATHVIQDKTGFDVISLSRAGAGNYDGAAIYAVNTLRYLNSVGFNIPSPNIAVAYFYEGNDLSDNQRFMNRYFDPEYNRDKLFDDQYFALFADKMDKEFCNGDLPRLQDKFLVGNYISRLIEGTIYAKTKKASPRPPGNKFQAVIGGEVQRLPDHLETNISQFSDEYIQEGVRFFERSLNKLTTLWPDTQKYIVYIPSPLTTYPLDAPEATKAMATSIKLEEMVVAAAKANGFDYIDFASIMRKAAQDELLHGPKDWGHLNKAGYNLLGTSIAAHIMNN